MTFNEYISAISDLRKQNIQTSSSCGRFIELLNFFLDTLLSIIFGLNDALVDYLILLMNPVYCATQTGLNTA